MSRMLLGVAVAALLVGSDSTARVGVIEGTVRLEQASAPRRASRYPGGAAQAHEIQSVPAVVYLVGRIPGGAPGSTPLMTQRDTAFVPPLVTVRRGEAVSFPNADPFFHNVFSYSSAQRFDLGRYPQGESKSVTFPEPGIVEVFCEVHEFMRGAILVTENSFNAVIAADGSFRISGVPDGEHTIAIWHPDHRLVERRVVVTAGATTRIEVELER
jgi:plastocyanin